MQVYIYPRNLKKSKKAAIVGGFAPDTIGTECYSLVFEYICESFSYTF